MRSFILLSFIIVLILSCSRKIASPPTPAPSAVSEVKQQPEMPKAVTVRKETAEVTAGKEIYLAKCGRCHSLKNTAEYTVQEWAPIMERMAMKSHLEAGEKANVTAYVNFYAKSGS